MTTLSTVWNNMSILETIFVVSSLLWITGLCVMTVFSKKARYIGAIMLSYYSNMIPRSPEAAYLVVTYVLSILLFIVIGWDTALALTVFFMFTMVIFIPTCHHYKTNIEEWLSSHSFNE